MALRRHWSPAIAHNDAKDTKHRLASPKRRRDTGAVMAASQTNMAAEAIARDAELPETVVMVIGE